MNRLTLKNLGISGIILLCWIGITCFIQAVTNPSMTSSEVLLNVHNSMLLSFKKSEPVEEKCNKIVLPEFTITVSDFNPTVPEDSTHLKTSIQYRIETGNTVKMLHLSFNEWDEVQNGDYLISIHKNTNHE